MSGEWNMCAHLKQSRYWQKSTFYTKSRSLMPATVVWFCFNYHIGCQSLSLGRSSLYFTKTGGRAPKLDKDPGSTHPFTRWLLKNTGLSPIHPEAGSQNCPKHQLLPK